MEFWLLIAATGIATGISAGLLTKILGEVENLAWGNPPGDFLEK